MEVQTLSSTPDPEQLVCQAARGDYYDGFVGDVSIETLMASVEYDDEHVQAVVDVFYGDEINGDGVQQSVLSTETEQLARQYALLERLFRRGHWGPFEHPQITLAIEGISRSCMAQLTRHRHASFDVQSMRYVDFSDSTDPAATPSSLTDGGHFSRETGQVALDGVSSEYARDSYEDLVADAFDWYERMVEHGVPKEDARFVLPIGTRVNLTVSMNARMLLHVEDMRKKADAQWEIREMTEMVHDEFADWMPMTAHLYDQHGPHKLAP